MVNISKSPDKGSFNRQNYLEKLRLDPTDESALGMIEYYDNYEESRRKNEQDPEWQKDNLEYDLRTSEYILDKVRKDEYYAQNLYAAMCNNEFIKNETWNILQDKTWSCSWRYAGGILADMCQKGDYIDWYCSGIRADWTDEEFQNATKEDQEKYLLMKNNHVGEGYVTDEVKEDLFKLGWVVKEE